MQGNHNRPPEPAQALAIVLQRIAAVAGGRHTFKLDDLATEFGWTARDLGRQIASWKFCGKLGYYKRHKGDLVTLGSPTSSPWAREPEPPEPASHPQETEPPEPKAAPAAAAAAPEPAPSNAGMSDAPTNPPRKGRGFARIRIQETKALLEGRLSIAGVLELPDTVDSLKLLSFMLEHIANTKGNVRRAMRQCCELYASSWLDEGRIEAVIDDALDEASYRPGKWTARAAGDELGVTDEERSRYGLTTFRAIDVDDAEYERRHNEANAERQQRYRDNRKMKRPKKPKTEPWELLNPPTSRATFFRRGLHRKG